MRHWITSFRLLTTPLFKEEPLAGQGFFPGAPPWFGRFRLLSARRPEPPVDAPLSQRFRGALAESLAVLHRETPHVGEAAAHRDRGHAVAASFDRRCEAWDRLAGAAVSDLIADRDPLIEQRLGDAVFRLRRP